MHLRQPELVAQVAQGTLSLDWWDDALSTRDAAGNRIICLILQIASFGPVFGIGRVALFTFECD